MADEKDPAGATEEPEEREGYEIPGWLTATESDFQKADLNKPVMDSDTLDCGEIGHLYEAAASAATSDGHHAEYKVYAMIAAVCSFHAKPEEPNEPFGPILTMADGSRSPVPTDFRGLPEGALLSTADAIEHPAVRARVNDMLWLLDKSRAKCARTAIHSYLELIEASRISKNPLGASLEEADFCLCIDLLRRALTLARAIGWESDESLRARRMLTTLRNEASSHKKILDFVWAAELDFDVDGSEPLLVAAQAEALVPLAEDLHRQHTLWQLASKGYAYAEASNDQFRCLIQAAECLVKVGEAGAGSAMYQAHWLEKAINELHRVPGTKDRRRQLKHNLIDVQSRIPDEFSTFSQQMDLSDVAEQARKIVEGKPFLAAISLFCRVAASPSPIQLREQAFKSIKDHPLSTLFTSTLVDREGKPIHRSSGAGEDQESTVRQQIVQAESIRRTMVVGAQIEPIRQLIMEQYQVTDGDFAVICERSPFIPPGHEAIFMRGFARFIQGDMIGALHILVPQLENSIRYVLKSVGYDVVKLNNDMTQEDLDLSALLRMRDAMERIFGAALTLDIDNVFNHRAGPTIRHNIAHGKPSANELYGNDASYACWLILQVTCLPLLPEWDKLTEGDASASS